MDYETLRKNKLVVFKTVYAEKLEEATSNGWVLIQVLTESQVVQGTRFETKAGYWDHTRNVQVPSEYHQEPSAAYSVHKYLLARSEDSALAMLSARIDALEKQAAYATEEIATNVKVIAEKNKAITQHVGTIEVWEKRHKENSAKIDQLIADVVTMKGDDKKLREQLERCRRELGERQFKKIVEPESPA
jgi:hypothetical protein